MKLKKENLNIPLLLFGRTTSMFGSSMYLIILPLYILAITGSLKSSGFFFCVVNIPAIILTPFSGIIIEKINRKNSLIFCDFMTALCFFVLYLFHKQNSNFYFYFLLIISMCINILSKVFEISSKVLFTEITTETTIEKYNGIRSFLDNGSSLIAPVFGTYLYAIIGFQHVLIIIAVSYLISAIQEAFIIYHKPNVNTDKEKTRFFMQLKSGIAYVTAQRTLLFLFVVIMSLNFFVANNDEIIHPGILIEKYKISSRYYGYSSTSAILGSLVSGFFIFKNKIINLKKYIKELLILNSLLMILTGVLSIVCYPYAKNRYFIIFLVLQFFIGLITTLINVPIGSYLQTTVPIEYQGRFFSLLSFSSSLLVPLGINYTGYLSSRLQADTTYIINNICVIMIIVLLLNKKKLI